MAAPGQSNNNNRPVGSRRRIPPPGNRPPWEQVLRESDIGFEEFTGDPLEAYTRETLLHFPVSPAPPGTDFVSRLRSLPNEILLRIIEAIPSSTDKILIAFRFPELFISERVNVFVLDVLRQRSLSHVAVSLEEESRRTPLLLEAISSHRFSFEAISFILNQYQAICIERNIDPTIFLNCDFPAEPIPDTSASDSEDDENGRAFLPLLRELYPPFANFSKRQLLPALHTAIHALRPDVVRDLIRRGANVEQSALIHDMELTPFQFAMYLIGFGDDRFYMTEDPNRNQVLRDIALELTGAPGFSAHALSEDFEIASQDLLLAMEAEEDNFAVFLFERSEHAAGGLVGAAIDLFDTFLLHCLHDASRPMPRLITYLLDNEAEYPQSHGQQEITSLLLGIPGMEEAAVAAFRWQLREWQWSLKNGNRQDQQQAHIYLRRSLIAISELARSDENLAQVQLVARTMIESNHYAGQSQLLLAAMEVGPDNAIETRKWLLEHLDAVDGNTWKRALVRGCQDVSEYFIERIRARGSSIDEPLETLAFNPRAADNLAKLEPYSTHDAKGQMLGFYGTALNVALAARNYWAASHLLSLGANPDLVQANIRHRVLKSRRRLQAGVGIIGIEVPFKMLHGWIPSGADPAAYFFEHQNELLEPIGYLFARLLDDPAHPLPPYYRPQLRHPELPEDDVRNDSDQEEDGRGPYLEGVLNGLKPL